MSLSSLYGTPASNLGFCLLVFFISALLVVAYVKLDVRVFTPLVHAFFICLASVIAGMCGVNSLHCAVAFLVATCTTAGYYLHRAIFYLHSVFTRSMHLGSTWSLIPRGLYKKPYPFWSSFTEDGYTNATFRVNGVLKEYHEAKAMAIIEELARDHLDVLTRKRSDGSYRDEYNVMREGKWPKHARYFLREVAIPAIENRGISDLPDVKLMLALLNEIVPVQLPTDGLRHIELGSESSGVDYELHVSRLLEEAGWSISMTPASGDHGADILASKEDLKVALQCKYYSSSVGNSSVQEAYAAKGFYRCDLGVVVSNAQFTKAARIAATNLNVPLVHHDNLVSVLEEYLAPARES